MRGATPFSFNKASSDADCSITENSFYKRIEAAYTYANKTLLKLLLEEEHLLSRLE